MRLIQTLLAAAILLVLAIIANDLHTIATLTPRLASPATAATVAAPTSQQTHEQRVLQAMHDKQEADDYAKARDEAAARLSASKR